MSGYVRALRDIGADSQRAERIGAAAASPDRGEAAS
jgi:hypothetical protein